MRKLPDVDRWYVRAGLYLLIAGVAFLAGRSSAPLEVVNQTSFVAFSKQKILTVQNDHQTEAKAKVKVVYVDLVISPDGTVREKSQTIEKEDSTTEAKSQMISNSEIEIQTKRETKTTTVNRPYWRVGLQVGASFVPPPVKLGETPLVLGLTVDVRLGKTPFFVGGWGGTYGSAGLSVSGEF